MLVLFLLLLLRAVAFALLLVWLCSAAPLSLTDRDRPADQPTARRMGITGNGDHDEGGVAGVHEGAG